MVMKRILMGEGESVEARPLTRSSALIGRDALSREAARGEGAMATTALRFNLVELSCVQFQRRRCFSSRPARPKITSTTARISRISANISAAL
jgi:hypothetical protein